MKREILMSGSQRETRVAILEDDRLVELLVDRPDVRRSVGNIYRGRVDAVLPGIQAAFVEIGSEKSAFLHASDLIEPDDDDDDEDDENGGNGNGGGNGGRHRGKLPNIQDVVKRGEMLLVQVTKEPISTKGPRVTTQISLPGRYLVYMPYASKVGVSRKIDAREERARLRQLVGELLKASKDGGGVIVRTVAEDATKDQLKRELKSLLNLWSKIKRKATFVRPPALVQREASLTSGIIRDLFSEKVDHLYIDSKQVYNEVKLYLNQVDPDLISRITLHNDPTPLFEKFDIETELAALHSRRVDLPTGGYVIIEPTEALVSIDVNTGRYTGKKDPEKTILRTNLEAAREIARQLRLRDIGGIIVIDFIDMETRGNREKVLQEVRAHLGRDRARTKAFEVSGLGLIEMTRQRVRPSLLQSMTEPCPACTGTGRVFKPEVVAGRLERTLRRVAHQQAERRVTVRLHPEVALYLLEEEPTFLKDLRKATKLDVEIRDDPILAVDEFRLVSQPAGRDVTQKWAVA
ncbi:MAG TPA: Rne/Rng family ribonuclease [Gemmatimonadales bacterium]